MDISTLRVFFMWCSIINVAILIVSSIILVFAGDFVYRAHSKWFPMPRETFSVVIYSWLGLYKIAIFVFNIVPYVALALIA